MQVQNLKRVPFNAVRYLLLHSTQHFSPFSKNLALEVSVAFATT